MPNTPDIRREVPSANVVIRFALRALILSVFATLGSQGFGKTLERLLILSVFYCIFTAAIRHEAPFGPVLTHLDEAAAYVVTARLVSWIS
jgi:hypothetical protein